MASGITLMKAKDSIIRVRTLADSVVDSSYSNEVQNLVIGPSDTVAMKELLISTTGLAYMSFTSSTVEDTALNSNSLVSGIEKVADSLVLETVPPTISSFDMNLETQTVKITFSEPIL